jgi:hypothetical protein
MPNPSSNLEVRASVVAALPLAPAQKGTRAIYLGRAGASNAEELFLLPIRKYTFSICVLLFTLLLGASLFAQKKSQSGSVFVPDKGKFKVLLDGKTVGQEEFEINPSGVGWIAKGTNHFTVEGTPPATVTGNLSLSSDGAPISYEWTSQSDKNSSARILFANGVAKMTVQLGSAHSFEQDLTFNSPLIVVLDDNLYYQYALLARVYDWNRRGTQTFSVLVPQELLPGTITVDWAGAVSAEGKAYGGLKVTTNDLEVLLYLDSNHRLMRLEVPSSKAAVIRE